MAAVASDLAGKRCEEFDVARGFGGSQGHWAAPVAKRKIEITRAGAQTPRATVPRAGLDASQRQMACEVATSTNGALARGGRAPAWALLGYKPREPCEPEV